MLFARLPCAAACLIAISACGSLCLAGYTPISAPPPAEKSVKQILDHVYGTTFVASGVNYVSPTLTAHRILDTPESAGRGVSLFDATNLVYSPDGDGAASPATQGTVQTVDQLWTADNVNAVARARYAAYNQEFGFCEGTAGESNYVSLFDLQGSGFDVSGSAPLNNMSGRIWRWARTAPNAGPVLVTSQNADNPLGIDHMVTYRIDPSGGSLGGSTSTTYLLFWEDKLPGDNPDYDYNDLVVEIQATSASPAPEPASSGLIALAGLLATRAAGRRRAVK